MRKILQTLLAIAMLSVLSANASTVNPFVLEGSLNVRTGPGVQFRLLGSIPAGEYVYIGNCIPAPHHWCAVTWNGIHGWASGRYLESDDLTE